MNKNNFLFKESEKYIPGGVNSPVRSFYNVGGTPIFIKKAKGAYLYDINNNKYVDFINSWGPMILGHSNSKVIRKTINAIKNGSSFGTPTEIELELAKTIISSVKNIEMIRMVNSGTEACMSAIRLARGFTKKNKIIKFEGCYHGHSDGFLVKSGSATTYYSNANSLGIPYNTIIDTVISEFNNIEQIKDIFRKENDIAAVIIEPVAGNMGCIPPDINFLKEIKKLCIENNSLLIFDEVMTGFRLCLGGAQEKFNIDADIITYGKIIGGGFPVGAFAARKEIMEYLSPIGGVYQAGTLSGNPVCMAAGLETISILKKDNNIYNKINNTTIHIKNIIQDILNKKSIPHVINQYESMISVFFSEKSKITSFKEVQTSNLNIFNKFFHHLLKNNIYIPPSQFESWFISNAITYKEIDLLYNAVNSFEL